MTDRERALKRVQMLDFVMDELNLYLDTHPTDKRALEYFAQYQYLLNDAVNQYEMKYGPLNADASMNPDSFDWVKGPWPWESEGIDRVDLR